MKVSRIVSSDKPARCSDCICAGDNHCAFLKKGIVNPDEILPDCPIEQSEEELE